MLALVLWLEFCLPQLRWPDIFGEGRSISQRHCKRTIRQAGGTIFYKPSSRTPYISSTARVARKNPTANALPTELGPNLIFCLLYAGSLSRRANLIHKLCEAHVIVVMRERDGRNIDRIRKSKSAALSFVSARIAQKTEIQADETAG
jgi:hypothetical protein